MRAFDRIEDANAFALAALANGTPVSLIVVSDDGVIVCETPSEVPDVLPSFSSSE